MLLTRLYELSQHLEQDPETGFAPTMYCKERVRYIIDLAPDGAPQGVASTTGAGKKPELGRELDIPALSKKRALSLAPKLLADNGQYVLGLAPEGKSPERAADSLVLFRTLVEECARETGEAAVQAVARFYADHGPAALMLPADFDSSANLTFRIGGEFPIELPAVQAWWADRSAREADSREGQCCVTGRRGAVIERLPQPIKRIPGGQVSGLPLISMNAAAFESYGLKASYNAPVSLDAAERFGKALNWLLASDRHCRRIGEVAYVYWTNGESDLDLHDLMHNPDQLKVGLLFDSVWRGSKHRGAKPELQLAGNLIDRNAFYAAALTASGSRVVVRDWVETTLGNVKRNLARWFALQELTDPYGAPGRPCGDYALVASLFRDMNRENPKLVNRFVTDIYHVALAGGRLPDYIAAQALRRNLAEQGVTQPRARVLKLWLLSQPEYAQTEDEAFMTKLERTAQDPGLDPGYLCGRMLAVLEQVQRQAIPGAKATIIDRYFGTASSAPASVFGTLLRGSQAHLAKLRKNRPGAYSAITRRLEEISEPLGEFPRTLTLKQQALFSLGYYHERAANRAQAKARKDANDLELDTDIESDTDSNPVASASGEE